MVIELLSKSTAGVDKDSRLLIYQDKLQVPEYYWFNPRNGHMAGYELVEGVYRPIERDRKGRLKSRKLGLLLVRWKGTYAGVEGRWLRWATPDGTLLPTAEEVSEAERRRAEEAELEVLTERNRAEEAERQAAEERERAERLAARLRALGGDPNV